jgi:hypothetical protein
MKRKKHLLKKLRAHYAKKHCLVLICALMFSGIVYADEIYLKDTTLIRGKVIRVTEKNVEIDPEGSIPFDSIPRENVRKIVYGENSKSSSEKGRTSGFKGNTKKTDNSGSFYLSVGMGVLLGGIIVDYKDNPSLSRYEDEDDDCYAAGILLLSGHVSLGYMFSDYIHAEVYGMTGIFLGGVDSGLDKDGDGEGDSEPAVIDSTNLFAAVKIYPFGRTRFGLFGKAGFGFGWVDVEYEINEREYIDSASGYAYMFGGGLEFPVGIALCCEFYHQECDDDPIEDFSGLILYVSYTVR